jgi:cyclic pyranopterin phosphate synthase
MARKLSHLDARGRVRMVDVSAKRVTLRTAVAHGRVFMHRDTLALLRDGRTPKGDVFAAAHLAGVMAAKRTAELIPLAHPLALEAVDLAFTTDDATHSVTIEARVRNRGRTGCEMEALTAVTVAGLTVIDMFKALDPTATLTDVRVESKDGGRSGAWTRSPV